MHSVVSLPDFHIHTHWSGQSEIVLWIIHDVKISIKNRQCSSFLTDIFKCLFHPDSSHFWAPSLVRTWKKGHIVDQLWYRGQQKKVLFFYRLESFRKHRHLLVPFQGFHQKWCYFFFFWASAAATIFHFVTMLYTKTEVKWGSGAKFLINWNFIMAYRSLKRLLKYVPY